MSTETTMHLDATEGLVRARARCGADVTWVFITRERPAVTCPACLAPKACDYCEGEGNVCAACGEVHSLCSCPTSDAHEGCPRCDGSGVCGAAHGE